MNANSQISFFTRLIILCLCIGLFSACSASNLTRAAAGENQSSPTTEKISKSSKTSKSKSKSKQTAQTESKIKGDKILVMPLDVELSLLTAAGLQEPNAEWTELAINYLTENINKQLTLRGVKEVQWYERSSDDPLSDIVQLEKLHEAIGVEMFSQQTMPLPTRKNSTEPLTLGETAHLLALETGNDKALFVFVRDSYASAGRAAAMVVGAMLGVGMTGGMQVGFASLVDLETGDIVWFNRLLRGSGDLRKQDPAEATVKYLLKDMATK